MQLHHAEASGILGVTAKFPAVNQGENAAVKDLQERLEIRKVCGEVQHKDSRLSKRLAGTGESLSRLSTAKGAVFYFTKIRRRLCEPRPGIPLYEVIATLGAVPFDVFCAMDGLVAVLHLL